MQLWKSPRVQTSDVEVWYPGIVFDLDTPQSASSYANRKMIRIAGPHHTSSKYRATDAEVIATVEFGRTNSCLDGPKIA